MSKLVEDVDHERRLFIGTAAMGIAAAAGALLPEHLAAADTGQHSNQATPPMGTIGADALRPFRWRPCALPLNSVTMSPS